MDFGTWSPSHTILVLVVLVTFIGQVAVYFYRTAQNDKRIDEVKAEVKAEIKEVRSDMNQRLSDVQSEIRDVRKEISDVRLELSKLNQNHVDHLTHHHNN